MGNSKTARTRVIAAERREQALELRKQGYSYREIGTRIGVSGPSVHRIVTTALQEIGLKCASSAEENRQLELEKLDRLERQLNEQIAGTADALLPPRMVDIHKAMELLLKVASRRARLLGLDAPTRILVPVGGAGDEKGRVEVVMADPRLAEILDEGRSWEPPRLAIAEPSQVPPPEQAPPEQQVG